MSASRTTRGGPEPGGQEAGGQGPAAGRSQAQRPDQIPFKHGRAALRGGPAGHDRRPAGRRRPGRKASRWHTCPGWQCAGSPNCTRARPRPTPGVRSSSKTRLDHAAHLRTVEVPEARSPSWPCSADSTTPGQGGHRDLQPDRGLLTQIHPALERVRQAPGPRGHGRAMPKPSWLPCAGTWMPGSEPCSEERTAGVEGLGQGNQRGAGSPDRGRFSHRRGRNRPARTARMLAQTRAARAAVVGRTRKSPGPAAAPASWIP